MPFSQIFFSDLAIIFGVIVLFAAFAGYILGWTVFDQGNQKARTRGEIAVQVAGNAALIGILGGVFSCGTLALIGYTTRPQGER